MITLEFTIRKYKKLVNPVLGTRKQHQTGFFSYDVIAFISTIKGYIKSFFFLQVEQQRQKRKVNKSTSIKILITRQGNKLIAQRHKIRSAIVYLRDQFPFYEDRFNEYLSLES